MKRPCPDSLDIKLNKNVIFTSLSAFNPLPSPLSPHSHAFSISHVLYFKFSFLSLIDSMRAFFFSSRYSRCILFHLFSVTDLHNPLAADTSCVVCETCSSLCVICRVLLESTRNFFNCSWLSLMLSNIFLNSLYCGIANASARSKTFLKFWWKDTVVGKSETLETHSLSLYIVVCLLSVCMCARKTGAV